MLIGVDGRELQGHSTGTGRYLRNLLREWARGPHRLRVYTTAPADPVPDGVEVEIVPRGRGPGLFWQELRLAPAASAVDAFFSPAYTCPLRLDRPRVTAVHDVSFFAYPQDFRLLDRVRRQRLVAASIRASAAVLACSEFSRREIGRFFPAQAARVHHVPLGPDDDLPSPPERDAARARLGVTGPYVITVGSILNRRRIPDLFRAVAELRQSHPGVVLDVVGENRTEPRRDLAALVQRLGIDGAVRLSGFVDEPGLADRYAAADAAVFLSEYEGFGLPPLEAMARGVPVVTSTRPSLSEIFAPAALLVEPRDVPGIAGTLRRVLSEDGLAADLVARGHALAARYSWKETARRTLAVIEDACRTT